MTRPPAAGRIETALACPLVFVTGKGGTGKTSVAAALSRIARRAEVCPIGDIDAEAALAEWLSRHVGAAGAALLRRSQAFTYLVAAAPGAAELVTIGKVVDIASHRPVIADGPSTGHALGMLAAPRTFARVAQIGPIAREASELQRRLEDPKFTCFVGVALPEPMAIAELLDLDRSLPDVVGRGLDLIVMNAVHPDRFSDEEAERLEAASVRYPMLQPVLVEHRRARREASRARELRERVGVPIVTLPFVFPPDDCVTRLADAFRAAASPSPPRAGRAHAGLPRALAAACAASARARTRPGS